MTTDEAYEEAVAAVQEFREAGIPVVITPSRSREDPEIVKRYSGPERISPDKWISVSFSAESGEHVKLVHEKARYLGWLGIVFDTGGGFGSRDWELDWSFKYTGQPDGDAEEARDIVENMIQENTEG